MINKAVVTAWLSKGQFDTSICLTDEGRKLKDGRIELYTAPEISRIEAALVTSGRDRLAELEKRQQVEALLTKHHASIIAAQTILEAARPLVLNLERCKDASIEIAQRKAHS